MVLWLASLNLGRLVNRILTIRRESLSKIWANCSQDSRRIPPTMINDPRFSQEYLSRLHQNPSHDSGEITSRILGSPFQCFQDSRRIPSRDLGESFSRFWENASQYFGKIPLRFPEEFITILEYCLKGFQGNLPQDSIGVLRELQFSMRSALGILYKSPSQLQFLESQKILVIIFRILGEFLSNFWRIAHRD